MTDRTSEVADDRLLMALEVLEDHDMLEEANTLRLRAKMKEASEEVSDG